MKFELITCDRCGVKLEKEYQREEGCITTVDETGLRPSYRRKDLILCKECNDGLGKIQHGVMIAKSKIEHEYIYGEEAKKYIWKIYYEERGNKDEGST